MNTRLSKVFISGFVKKNNIDLSDYYSDDFKCFNDCFTRRIREGKRPMETDVNAFVSPCDAFLSVYNISDDLSMDIKGSRYTVSDLLGNNSISGDFDGGYALVFRLCVHHYHRYVYFDSGKKGENVFIPGKLHTVRPIALETYPVFIQNCREYTVMETDNFGKAIQIEVGALLVGKIQNHHGEYSFSRGEEKGTFLYGGSTVVLLLEKDKVLLRDDLIEASMLDSEVAVIMGERLGYSQAAS